MYFFDSLRNTVVLQFQPGHLIAKIRSRSSSLFWLCNCLWSAISKMSALW